MSAFLVSKLHIDGLVVLALLGPRDAGHWFPLTWYAGQIDPWTMSMEELGVLRREASPDRAAAIGQMLVDANAASIAARYGSDAPEMDQPYVRHYRAPALYHVRRPIALEGLKMCACYRYQSVESSNWERSEAAQFIDNLEHAIISALPGYDKAAGWEWRG